MIGLDLTMPERGNFVGRAGFRRAAGLFSIGVVALTSGCSGPESDTSAASTATVSTEPIRHLGLFVAGDFIEFEACSGEPYSIDGPVLADLVSMRDQLVPGLEPLEAVFVDLLGTISDPASGPALDAIEMRRVAYEGGGAVATIQGFSSGDLVPSLSGPSRLPKMV